MRRIRALLGKELRQHAGTGLALAVCLAGVYGLALLGHWMGPETVSLMQTHARFLGFLTLAALVLGHRLVVAEYYGHTQLFVEALPLARWEMVAVKYGLGLALLLLAGGASLGATTLAALSREAIDGRFLGIVAARSGSYLFCAWSFFFAMGLVGRFRVPIYLAIVLGLTVVDQMTAFEIQRFGPLAVLDGNTLPFEREVLPVRAVLHTLALGAAWTLFAFALALIHEGSVAEALARRMSQREKALIGGLFVALLLALAFLDERRDKDPYDFPHDEVVSSDAVPLDVLYLLPELESAAKTLLGRLEGDLAGLGETLGWTRLPEIRVAYGPSLDAGLYDRAELEDHDGIVVRANFAAAAGWDAGDFSAFLSGLALDEATDGRAAFEPKAWLRDGFAQWWSLRGAASPGPPDLDAACEDGLHLPRALWATRRDGLDAGRLAAWHLYRERHGEDLAEAVALSGLLVLERRHRRDAVLALARAVFGRRPPRDARELLYEWRNPMAAVFEKATGVAWADHLADWNAELDRLRRTPACARVLAAVPDGEGILEIERGDGSLRHVVYGFRLAAPPPPETLATLLHRRLTAFDTVVERRELRREENPWPAGESRATWRLPGFYNRGSRAFLALEIPSPALGCPIRFLAVRRDVR